MALRCLLFSSDEGTAEPVRQALAGLGVEGEYCSEAVAAVEKVTHQNFQIVIIDWDIQPDAGLLLTAARERKAAERPLTLAIVSDDGSVPKALQAGANSILRKPLLVNQVKDTLTTARDLLRAKQESAAAAAAGASAGSAGNAPQADETSPRAENFLESSPSVPIGQFVAKSHAPEFVTALEPIVSPESEPVPVAVTEEKFSPSPAAPASPPPPDGPKGLEWYLKTRLGNTRTRQAVEQAPSPSADELLGYAQMTSTASKATPPKSSGAAAGYASERKRDRRDIPESTKEERKNDERKKEAELFAYMAGEKGGSEKVSRPKSRLKGAIVGALVLAGCAILAAPQAPWHANMRGVWTRGRQAMHGWLNPQPVTPVQAPAAHENFGRAGDEYKLPVEENIPDATTDPSQIQVVPVVDPTAKKPNNDATNPVQPAGPPDATGATPSDQTSAPAVQIPDKQPSPSTPDTGRPASGGGAPASLATPALVTPVHSDLPAPAPILSSAPSLPAQLAPAQKLPHERSSSSHVPSSLKSQISSMTPEASGNKPPEAAMNSIEPVAVPEAVERALLTEQPALGYPANAGGQHGTVILQVLIGRDGNVQDAKFLQGSLVFAKVAIDGVRQWKFKPYSMNGRAVSVQTLLTIGFKPVQ
jgi:periplasmic protein TonB